MLSAVLRGPAMCLSAISKYPWRFLALVIAVYLLSGCALFGRTQAETGAVQGVVAGQPVAVKWTRDTEGKTTVELPPALMQAAGALIPSPWREVADAGLTLLAGGSLLHAHRTNKRAKNKDGKTNA
jgi:uncharacterized protein YceK